jgi:hypothetical protein
VNAPLSTRREFDRLIFNRAALLWLHVICALTVGIAFLSVQDFSHLAYWTRGGALGVSIAAAIPMLPYWMSSYQSRRRVNYHRRGFFIFCVIILLGTGFVVYLYLSEPILHTGQASIGLSVVQMVLYVGMVGSCLGNDIMPTS